MKYKLIKQDYKKGCDSCCFDVEGEPCKFPDGRPACYDVQGNGGGIYVKAPDNE